MIDINPRILSERLKQLQDEGFIEKKIISEHPLKAKYILTKKGKSLSEEMDRLNEWAKKWM